MRLRPQTLWALLQDPAVVALNEAGIDASELQSVPEWQSLSERLWRCYPFDLFAPGAELEPMVRSAAGGHRLSPGGIFHALLQPAFGKLHALQVALDADSFVSQALSHLDDLCGILQGRPCEALIVSGVDGLRLKPSGIAKTPWGVLRPLPEPAHNGYWEVFADPARCSLVDRRLVSLKIDRSREPRDLFDGTEVTVEPATMLLPVASALAGNATRETRGVALTWRVVIPSVAAGFGSTSSLLRPKAWGRLLDINPDELSHWTTLVAREHQAPVDVAARRLGNALAYRWESADILIDAVMIWENLLGADTETTFRVTAALAKLIESDPNRRGDLKVQLGKIYALRSRVVHGGTAKPHDIDEAATAAVRIAVQALKASYLRGADWLKMKSHERSSALLLFEP